MLRVSYIWIFDSVICSFDFVNFARMNALHIASQRFKSSMELSIHR